MRRETKMIFARRRIHELRIWNLRARDGSKAIREPIRELLNEWLLREAFILIDLNAERLKGPVTFSYTELTIWELGGMPGDAFVIDTKQKHHHS